MALCHFVNQCVTARFEEGSGTILRRISEAASRCKSNAFSEEAEWRMVCEPSYAEAEGESIWTEARSPRFLERRGIITPFMEIPLVEGEFYRKRGNEPIIGKVGGRMCQEQIASSGFRNKFTDELFVGADTDSITRADVCTEEIDDRCATDLFPQMVPYERRWESLNYSEGRATYG
jgi:hypothetical protein